MTVGLCERGLCEGRCSTQPSAGSDTVDGGRSVDRFYRHFDIYIYANTSTEEAYAFHRRAEQLSREIFGTGAVVPFKEKAEFTDMMFYKTIILP